jgi:hypothetical protein
MCTMPLSLPTNLLKSKQQKVTIATTSVRAYHYVNLLIGIAFAGVILYSLTYKANSHPIPALLTEITGEIPPSKGLSASFSEIVRVNFDLATAYNPYGLRIFAFFALQLLLRAFFSMILMIKKNGVVSIILTDSIISTLLFACCFWPLITYTLQQVMQLVQHL